ncbi:hypothetical protein DSO57_1028869 [Entomophthora muscae]|uniref:Uncharacterized protein n=1 Tax=Entomophthora muscae TaxID=34485 RepID=A0ACC2RG19_9FUNG|nr:hypothetical protein DSO57_1028869 [Entomophthora muscae]
MYGRNKFGQCFISGEVKLGEALAFFLVVFMTTITLLYCILVPCIVIARIDLNTGFSHLKHYVNNHHPGFQSHFNMQLKRIILSSMLYPLACFLSMIGSLVYVYCMFIVTTPSIELFIFASVTRSLTGVFNLVAFLMDPSVQRALIITLQSFAFSCTEARLSSTSTYITTNPDTISISSQPLNHNASAILGGPPINIDKNLQTYLSGT